MNTKTHAQSGSYTEFSDARPSETCLHATTISVDSSDSQVWINVTSNVYHFHGQRWFKNTRNGVSMDQEAAHKAEHRATRNGQ